MKTCRSLMRSKGTWLSTLLFFVVFALSHLIYYSRSDPYTRPKLFFYLLAIAAGIVSYQILNLNTTKKVFRILIFFEIFLIALSFTATQQTLYKTVLGRDPWAHEALVSQIIRTHNIPSYEDAESPYVWMPNFHLLLSSSILISGINYKWASYISVGITTLIIEMLVIHEIGKLISLDNRVILLSILLLAISDNVLDMTGKTIIPNTIGVAIALSVFYLLLKNALNVKYKFLVVIYILSLSLLHTVSYAFMIIQTAIIFVILLYWRKYREAKQIGYTLIMMWVSAFLVWGLISGCYLRSFMFMIRKLLVVADLNGNMYVSSLTVPLEFVLLARLGMITYWVLAGIGTLYYFYINRKRLTKSQLALLVNGAFFIGFGALTFLIWPEIAHRFWYFGEILGSFFVAYFILSVKAYRKLKPTKHFLCVGLMIVLAWLMLVASVSNDDNPLVPEYTIRTGWYDSEIQAGLFLLQNDGSTSIASDLDYVTNLNHMAKTMSYVEFPVKTPKTFGDILNESGYLFILRKNLIEKRCFVLGSRWTQKLQMPLGNEIKAIMMSLSIRENVIYSSKSVTIYGVG